MSNLTEALRDRIASLKVYLAACEKVLAMEEASLVAAGIRQDSLAKPVGEKLVHDVASSVPINGASTFPEGVSLQGTGNEIVLDLVRCLGGARPRDIAKLLKDKGLLTKANAVHSNLFALKTKGLVQQNQQGLYMVKKGKAKAASAS